MTQERRSQLEEEFRAGRLKKVADAVSALHVDGDTDAGLLYLGGCASFRLRRYRESVAHLQAAVALNPSNAELWLLLAQAWYEMRQLAQAEYAWSRYESLGGADPAARRLRAIVSVARGKEPLDTSLVRKRIQYFDHSASLPKIQNFVTDQAIRLPITFSLGAERRMEACLTIDDSPSPDVTPVILATLRRRSVKAVFFVVGYAAERYPDLINQILDDGHAVYSHSFTHTPFTELDDDAICTELQRTEDVLSRHRPTPSPYPLRLPGGMGWRQPRIHAAIRTWSDQAILIHWNIDARDYEAPQYFHHEDDVELEARLRIFDMLLDPLFSAPILLTHDNLTSTPRKNPAFFARFFGDLVDSIRDVGLKFGLLVPPANDERHRSE